MADASFETASESAAQATEPADAVGSDAAPQHTQNAPEKNLNKRQRARRRRAVRKSLGNVVAAIAKATQGEVAGQRDLQSALSPVLLPKPSPLKKKKGRGKKDKQESSETRLLKQAAGVLKNMLDVLDPQKATPSKSPPPKRRPKSKAAQKPSVKADQASPAASEGQDAPEQGLEASSGEDAVVLVEEVTEPASSSSKAAAAPKAKAAKSVLGIENVDSRALMLKPVLRPMKAVPRLSYGLDRVLFNPGVYHLQDPRSRVYNFDPYLADIMPISEFDFKALKRYVTSSKDNTLIAMAQSLQKRYTGSTSSMTTFLAHFHYLLSAWRPINPGQMSRRFTPDSLNFTRINRAPSAAFLHWKDGVYAIDADKEFDTANVLSMLGKSMEKLLTLRKEDYERYRLTNPEQIPLEERNAEEAFHYTVLDDFLMRSQLDAFDRRVPGTGMFDLKTRAVVSIRMDARDYDKGRGYEIRGRFGQWESFEREYFDMIRSAFLKYSLQVRMGRMDGIFVAYHNTQRIFGFQYVSLPEMDLAIHGTEDTTLGDREFKLSLHLLNKLLDKATARFPNRSLRLHLEARPTNPPLMYFFAKPVEPEEIEKVQNANRESVEAFERAMTNALDDDEASMRDDSQEPAMRERDEEGGLEESALAEDSQDPDEDTEKVWDEMLFKVEETLENDELGATSVREAIEDALEQSGLLRARSLDESRQYVDALLEAITAPDEPMSPSKMSDESASDNAAESEAEMESESADLAGSPTTTVNYETEQVAQDESESAATQHGESTAASTGENGVDGQRKPLDDSDAMDEPGIEERNEARDGMSLKDLIIRLATQIRRVAEDRRSIDAPDEQVDDAMSVEDAKLRKFERILSKLTATSQEPAAGEEAEASADSDTKGRDEKPAAGNGGQDAELQQPQPAESTAEGQSDHAESSGVAVAASAPADDEVAGWILTVRNKVNGKDVPRPSEDMDKRWSWVVEYSVQELKAERAQRLYAQLLKRRRDRFGAPRKENAWSEMFRVKLRNYSLKGREFRDRETRLGQRLPVHVYGMRRWLRWDEAFGGGSSGGSNGRSAADRKSGLANEVDDDATESREDSEDGDFEQKDK